MTNILTISPISFFTIREILLVNSLTSQISLKLSQINTNQQLINTSVTMVLQKESGGAEQAKIPLIMSSAPTGWTRDTSFNTDCYLRVTDGTTVPSGANPTAVGGSEGGSHTISGLAAGTEGNHSHTIPSHTHTIAHTHGIGTHDHTMNHTHSHSHSHTTASAAVTLSAGGGEIAAQPGSGSIAYYVGSHTHDGTHTHPSSSTGSISTYSGSTVAADPIDDNGSSASDTNSQSSSALSSDGSHTHIISHNGAWRPKYTNVLICKRD